MTRLKRRAVLVILDGFSYGDSDHPCNAVAKAKTPTLDMLRKDCPFSEVGSFGPAVGLPEGQMGNSEVGHMNIGAGRVVLQEFLRIDKAIEEGTYAEQFRDSFSHAKKHGGRVHLMGLLGPGGVHAHERHMKAALETVAKSGLEVFVHPILDGRDTPPRSAQEYLETLESQVARTGVGVVADLVGRYFAMDRDTRWERTKRAYDLYVGGVCEREAGSAREALEACYAAGEDDEFAKPTLISADGRVREGDSIIWLNFRPDRSRQMTRAFMQPGFDGFEREILESVHWTCMTQYDDAFLKYPRTSIAFKRVKPELTLAEHISNLGLQQFHTAETEKYAHVTYFLNGGREEAFSGEDRVLVPSPKVSTYDLQPEMSAGGVTDALVEAMRSGKYDFLVVNYANPDMVGHTGVFDAAVEMIEFVDGCLARVLEAANNHEYAVLLTSDHGNCEEMCDEDGDPITAHTLNMSPLVLYNAGDLSLEEGGGLANIAPTLLEVMGLPIPAVMSAKSLLKNS